MSCFLCQAVLYPIIGAQRHIKENRDDPLSDRHSCRLQEMSTIQSLPPEKYHRRLQEAGSHANEAARKESTE
jgi:hypothetical protein